jgi:hypothetical protein
MSCFQRESQPKGGPTYLIMLFPRLGQRSFQRRAISSSHLLLAPFSQAAQHAIDVRQPVMR